MESNVTTIETANNNTTTITTDTRMDLILTRRGIENSANGRKNYKSIGTELIRDDDSKKYYYNTEGYDQLQEKHDELKRKFFELNKELEDKKKQPRLCDDDDGLDGKTIKILKALSKVKEKLNDKAYYDSIYVPAFEYFKKPDQKDYKLAAGIFVKYVRNQSQMTIVGLYQTVGVFMRLLDGKEKGRNLIHLLKTHSEEFDQQRR
ncbi:4952_t:CDS:2 [Entrophospora sp. SA101]|nr:4952_t:CDS:2 [Entrophospora sp. SA101]